ncbi:MAG TPA: AbrB/MazE/SpoVT family DNA-binding domain-containing protein [Chloroflexota bacterium]|nr:AbrB/MazE/SpoVT family DNA-binding domain-containing protein [Chloroflexota bacterium]
MRTKVSVRGQTVVPREIREALGIGPRDTLDWELRDGVIVVYPLPADPVRASLGILKGRVTLRDFLLDREEERARERAAERED